MIHVTRRLLENLRANRRRPPLERLAALTDPDRFVWGVLPYAARSFSFCIAVLPRATARPLATAYLYCRMLDTCEDLPETAGAKEERLAAFVARFAAHERDASAPIAPPPAIDPGRARDDADRVYLLLLARAEQVDRFFLSLPAPQRAVILRLVRRMGEGMIWAVRTFAAQGGELADGEQLSRYCFEVLGNPMRFAEEMQRLRCGLDPAVASERVRLAAEVGEAIQLANVARDLEKDCAQGVFYLPALRAARGGELPAAIAAARRELLCRALERGRAFRPYMAGIPSSAVSLARGAALLMALFTLAFWQRTAQRLGLGSPPARDRMTRAKCFALVARSVISRAGHDAVLSRLDRIFEEEAVRLAPAARPRSPREDA